MIEFETYAELDEYIDDFFKRLTYWSSRKAIQDEIVSKFRKQLNDKYIRQMIENYIIHGEIDNLKSRLSSELDIIVKEKTKEAQVLLSRCERLYEYAESMLVIINDLNNKRIKGD